MSIFYQTELSEQKETQKLIIHSSPSSTEAKRSSKNSECCQIQPSSELRWNINVMMHLVQNQIDSRLPACDVLAVCSSAMRCRVTLLLSAAAFLVFLPSECEVKIYTSFNQEGKRLIDLVHYLTHISGFDLSSWPPVCSFLRRLASESGGLAAGSTGAQGVGRSEMITAVCHCGWQLESHQWEERNGGKRGGSLPSGCWTGSASRVVSSQLQAYSGRNPFSLSFQKYISAQLHAWIIAGCEQCHLSERSSVFRGDALILSALKFAETPTVERWLMFRRLHSRDRDQGGYLVEQSGWSQPPLGPREQQLSSQAGNNKATAGPVELFIWATM